MGMAASPVKGFTKKNFPVSDIRRFLEPGPVVLLSSRWRNRNNIMTLGWHMVLGEEPSLVGCYIWDANHSFEMIRGSGECVINIPTVELATRVVGIGNSSGRDLDKFAGFGLTPQPGKKVGAPLIKECYAGFECRLADSSLIDNYSLFIFEVLHAHVATAPKFPQTLHYRGDGLFMLSGPTVRKYRKGFKLHSL